MNTITIRRGLTAAACTWLLAAGAAAQDDTGLDSAPWLQAEIIVFRQLDTSSAGDEQWPAHPQLAYPSAIEILRDPLLAQDAAPQASPTQPPVSAPPANTPSPMATTDTTPTGAPVPPREEPFLLLAPDTFLLRDAAARLSGAAGYRVLAHLAWRQPLPRGNSGSNILVTGGEPRDGHFELEGYVTLRREHFLHLDTSLWLNDFAAVGTTNTVPDTGVELPALPQPPAPLAPPIDPQTGLAPVAAASPSVAPTITAPSDQVVASAAADAGTDPSAMPGDSALVPVPVRTLRTVVLRATRRLRLGEIHYIDHPMFGVIVSLRAYDPDAAATATADAATTTPGSVTPAAPASTTP